MMQRFFHRIWYRIRHLCSKSLKKLKASSPYPEITGLLCILGTVFCTYVLVKWNTIPVYDYYINAEYYCPDTITKNLQTKVSLWVEPNVLLNTYTFDQSEVKEEYMISLDDTTKAFLGTNAWYYHKYDTEAVDLVSRELQYYTKGLFDDTIRSFLRWKEKPDRLFFVHMYSCAEQENIFVKEDTNAFYFAKDTLITSRSNGKYCVSILNRKIDSIFHTHEWQRSFLSSKHIYSHFSVLKIANNSHPLTNRIEGEMIRKNYRKYKIQTLMMPKDISRAYYRISFVSGTIPTYDLRVKFNQDVVFESLPSDYRVGVNSVEISNIRTSFGHGSYYNNVKIYAEFPDGESAQTVRTFFMALVITWLLKEFIKSLYRTYKKYNDRIRK